MKKQTLLGILGTLVLGALGSGLWELIKPGFSFLGSTALTVISLGFDSVVNDIYSRVGRANLPSTWIKSTALLILGVMFYVMTAMRSVRANTAPNTNQATVSRYLIGSLVFALFGAFIVVGAGRHAYVAKTRGHFDYLVRASAPYLSPEQRLSIDSRLALVTNRADYEALVVELKQCLKDNKVAIADDSEF
ncbi:hypothetical protein GBK02_12315 [Dechloromonas sp. TW-R-39-2]|uniref:hypothetical protein n=1 Tax=Dechloromonas sp. TW-R-39-2 TaxID=2654218 RepID=UPI00193E2B6A|nr:hypothetical protein [Dechloromonas sp. TW-R-39-2]QRM20116.1 hypothetical protein GBK02_12315 [Dechloromonas sp. TW-R-39-2]